MDRKSSRVKVKYKLIVWLGTSSTGKNAKDVIILHCFAFFFHYH